MRVDRANVDYLTLQNGSTALHLAALRGNLPVVEFLLVKEANLEAVNKVNVWRRAAGTDALTRITRGRVDSGLNGRVRRSCIPYNW